MKIGLLTSSPTSYKNTRFIEELTKRGHIPVVINYLRCYCALSKGKPSMFYEGEELDDLDAIIPQVAVSTTSYGATVIRQFEMMGVFSIVGSLALLRARDKARQLQLFSRKGIDIPRTVLSHTSSDSKEILKMVGGAPVIIKVNQGSLGKGVMIAESNQSARSTIDAFFSQGVEVLIQEYISESEGSDVRVIIVDNKIVASMKRKAAEGEFRSNIYQGGTALKVKLTPEERRMALKAAHNMHLKVAGVDFMQSNRGPLITEVNACPNLEGIEEVTGRNIAGEIVEFVERSVSKPSKNRKDKVGV